MPDINKYIPTETKSAKYADDLLTYRSFKNSEENTIQSAVGGVFEWTRVNKMELNDGK
jgi:hypothetical protein